MTLISTPEWNKLFMYIYNEHHAYSHAELTYWIVYKFLDKDDTEQDYQSVATIPAVADKEYPIPIDLAVMFLKDNFQEA